MNRRRKIRILSFILSAFVVLTAGLIFQLHQARMYKAYIDRSYQRAFYDTIDYMKSINSTLDKGVHSSSPDHFVTLSSEIFRQASGAKASIAQLPLSDIQTDNLQKFLAQIGDYAYYLSKKVLNNQQITSKEQDQLATLSQYANYLTETLLQMESKVNEGSLSISAIKKAASESNNKAETATLSSTLENVEKEFQDYPSLIYDGPFSDHIERLQPVLIKNSPVVSQQEAAKTAAKFIGVQPSDLVQSDGSNGTIETYSFNYATKFKDVISADISKKGGYPVELINSRVIGKSTITREDAIKKAESFLNDNGFKNMTESYYIDNAGFMIINFAYVQNNYTCYPDLIEVGVAMDNGDIVFFNARGYVMNHTDNRDIPAIAVSRSEAEKGLNPRLTVLDYTLAIIPTESKTELPVHAFLCANSDNKKYFVYINTQTGREEKILTIIESENGTLVM